MIPSLNGLAGTVTRMGDVTPELADQGCLNQRHQQAGQCELCLHACPVDAIRLTPAPRIDPGVCPGCGACAAVCPVSALQGHRSILSAYREARNSGIESGTATLVCRETGAGRFAATRIPCMSALPPEFYIDLAFSGVDRVLVYTADCADCPLGDSQDEAESAIEVATQFLTSFGKTLTVTRQNGTPPLAETHQSAVSRRSFLTSVFKTRVAEVESSDNLTRLTDAGHGWRHALFLDGLSQAEIPEDVDLATHVGMWGAVEISDACVGCEMCAQFCPTGALVGTSEAPDEVTLWFNVARCTACGLCERVCFKKAVSIADTVSLTTIATGKIVPIWQGRIPGNALR